MFYNQNVYTTQLAGYNTNLNIGSMAKVGCLIVSFANMLKYIGITTDPLALNEAFKRHGCFQPGGAFYIRGSISKVYPELIEENFDGFDVNLVNSALAHPDKIVILGVDFVKATPQTEWHFVGLYSKDKILDPNGGIVRSILTYPVRNVKIITRKQTMSQVDKTQLANWRQAQQTALTDIRLGELGEDIKAAVGSYDGDSSEASNIQYLVARLYDSQKRIQELEEEKDFIVAQKEDVAMQQQREIIQESKDVNNGRQSITTKILKPHKSSTEKKPWESKKFWAMISGVVTLIVAQYQPELQNLTNELVFVFSTYLAGQSVIDTVDTVKK